MAMPDMTHTIADGVALHAKEHPEDATRGIDGVVANQCLMATMGFAEGYYIRVFKRPVWGRVGADPGTRALHSGTSLRSADSLCSMRRSHYFRRATPHST